MSLSKVGGLALIGGAGSALLLIAMIMGGVSPTDATAGRLLSVAMGLATAGCLLIAIRPPADLAGRFPRLGLVLMGLGFLAVFLAGGAPALIGLEGLGLGFALVVVTLVRGPRRALGLVLGVGAVLVAFSWPIHAGGLFLVGDAIGGIGLVWLAVERVRAHA